MSYEDAFAAVPGCEVIWCEYFGSCSGRILAKIKYKGETRYIEDYYGSCYACDHFVGEFGDINEPTPENLANFGKPYVEGAQTAEQIISQYMNKPWLEEDEKAIMRKLEKELK